MNPEKWEDSDTMDSNSGVMVSNLPLIFAHGEPVSLSKMTQEELQVFVPFMVSCSIGEDPKLDWSQLRRPAWWPNKQPFRLPSASKSRMIQLVVDCYTFHGCQYLLQFCATLHQMRPSGGYKFTDNRDGTTSMYNGHNGKLLVTFRNENREYDLKSQKTKSHVSTQKKKRLLSNLPSNKKKNVMVQPPPNVYLCDKCDDEFLSFREVQAHEKQCKGNSPSTPPMPSPDPEDLEEEILDPAEQVPFLSYFGLQPAEHTGVAPYTSPRKRHQSSSPIRKFYNHSYLLDISSPMGKYILSRTKYGGRLQMPENYVTRYERHIRPSEADLVNLRERSSNRWIVVYRPRKEQQWMHKYCFNSLQKRERILAIQTGIDRRSRLLLANCQKVQLRVKLKRLAKKVVDRYTRRGGSTIHVPFIDLTGAEDNHDGGPIRRPSSSTTTSSFTSSLSTPFYFSPTTFLSNAASSSRCLPGEIAASGTYLNINSLVPSGTDIEANYFDNCTQNYDIDGNLIDPLEISENKITNSVLNSLSGKPPLSLPKSQNPNHSRNFAASEAILPFLSKNTQNKISTLSNNGVTVTSVANSDVSQSDSSSLEKFNAEKSHPHQANSKNNGSTDKLKISRSNCNSASNNSSRKSINNSSFSNHSSHPSKSTSSGASNTATNSNCLPNKKENVSLVEVIELSSDDDDTVQEKESHARSKNGYSHWSLDKSSSISGRDKRSLMSNGVPQDSSVLPSLPNFLSTSSSHNLFFRSSLFHSSNMPKSIYERNSTKILQTPMLTVDSDGIIKAPLQIDEDISFNIRLPNQVKQPLENKYSNILSDFNNDNNNLGCNNNNNNQYGNNLLYSLASKVNKGLQYITTFVRSKVCESNSGNTCVSSSVNNNNCNTNNNNICNANNNNDNDHDKNHVDNCLKVRKPRDDAGDDQEVSSLNLSQSVTSTKRSREMMSLLKDERRELKRRGIEMLQHLNEHDSRVITRCIAEKNYNQMFGLCTKEKFEELPSEFTESGGKDINNIFNGSGEVDLRCVDNHDSSIVKDITPNIASIGDESFVPNTLDFPFSPLPPTPPPQIEEDGFDENENYSPPMRNETKKPKLSRELSNLARDECKELRGMGFHPADILGSSEDGFPFILNSEESENEPNLSVKRRPNLLSYKNSSEVSSKENGDEVSVTAGTYAGNNLKQMMQGNKKISRELSKLMKDEWKELKLANAHPSQITNILSAERNVRSNSFHNNGKKPGIMTGFNSERRKSVFGRNARGQDNITVTETRNENPRLSQRKLIHTENGMCVLSYSIDDST